MSRHVSGFFIICLTFLLLAGVFINRTTIYDTIMVNLYLKIEAEDWIDEGDLPIFCRVTRLVDPISLPYREDDSSGRIGVSVYQANLTPRQAAKARDFFENTDSDDILTLEGLREGMGKSPLGYTEKLVERPAFLELIDFHEYHILDCEDYPDPSPPVIGSTVSFSFYDDYRKCYLVIYEPFAWF